MAPRGVQGLLETLFSPLEGLDIAYIYDRYHTGIDFVLYAFLLVFISRLGLSRTFPGENGRKLGTVTGIILAVALSIAERSLGFSIKSFGPIAAALVIITISLVLYNMIRHTGASHTASASTALIVTYFTMRAVLPGFFLWAKQNQWANYLHSILILAVAVALWKLIQTLFAAPEASPLRRAVERISEPFAQKETITEWKLVRNRLNKLTIRGKREAKHVIKLLEEIVDIIKEHGADEHAVGPVCSTLNDLKKREHVLASELSRIEQIDKLLLSFDLHHYEKLKDKYDKLSSEQQAQCKEQFAQEHKKIGVEKTIQNLAKQGDACAIQFEKFIDNASECLKLGQSENAIAWLNKAIAEETKTEEILEEIRKMEKTLLYLLRKQIQESRGS